MVVNRMLMGKHNHLPRMLLPLTSFLAVTTATLPINRVVTSANYLGGRTSTAADVFQPSVAIQKSTSGIDMSVAGGQHFSESVGVSGRLCFAERPNRVIQFLGRLRF